MHSNRHVEVLAYLFAAVAAVSLAQAAYAATIFAGIISGLCGLTKLCDWWDSRKATDEQDA